MRLEAGTLARVLWLMEGVLPGAQLWGAGLCGTPRCRGAGGLPLICCWPVVASRVCSVDLQVMLISVN